MEQPTFDLRPLRPAQTAQSKLISLGLVGLLHVAIVYALIAGLSRSVIEVLKGPIETKIIEEIPETDEPPPPPPPELDQPPPPFVPPPEISIDLPSTPAPTAIRSVQDRQAVPDTVARGRRLSKPPYPQISIRLSEEGTVRLRLFIDAEGRVEKAEVEKTSGYPRLDEAAMNHALRSWRFNPAVKAGQPVASWVTINFVWQLKDAR